MAEEQRVYVGQTALQIQLDTKIDLTTFQSGLIKYVDPAGAAGSWSAIVVGSAADGIIGTSTPPTLSEGLWKIWAFITFADSTVAPGDPTTFFAYIEGQ